MQILRGLLDWLSGRRRLPEFTPRAQVVFALARKVAVHRRKAETGPDDVLLGICVLKAGLGFGVLCRSAWRPDDIVAHFNLMDGWQKTATPEGFRYADSVKIALALASEESRRQGHTHVGTEHILVALTDDRTGSAGFYLKKHGVSSDSVRKLLAELQRESKPAQPGATDNPGVAQ